MNIDRILANLRRERAAITEAIAALEKSRMLSRPTGKASVKTGRRKKRTVASRADSRLRQKIQQDTSHGAKIIPFVSFATRVS